MTSKEKLEILLDAYEDALEMAIYAENIVHLIEDLEAEVKDIKNQLNRNSGAV